MDAAKGVGPEAATYAAALRAAVHEFTTQGGTQREIAVATHVAPATLSRYLSGERIAPSGYVAALEIFLAQRGRPMATDTRSRLDELCGLAHQASGSPAVQLAHLKEELARIRKEKTAGKAELAALKKHADQLAAELRQAVDEARHLEQGRLKLQERVADQDKNLDHAQSYTRQLQAELTALQEQVVLIQHEVKILRRQNKGLLEEQTTAPAPGTHVKATVSGASTQVTGTKRKAPRPSAETTRDGKKGKRRRQEPRPTDGLRQQASETGTPGGMGRETPVFSVSWTGDEAPKSFSKNTLETPGSLCALLGGAFVLYALSGSAKGNPSWAYILGSTFMVIGMVLADDLRPHKKLRRIMRARTLRLDSTGLTTSDPSGKQHLPWTAIKKISIHHTREIDSRTPLALHIQLKATSAEASRIHRPAGWPLSQDPPESCRRPARIYTDEWVPVCVLGPLTGPDQTDLRNAVTTYLKTPLEGVW